MNENDSKSGIESRMKNGFSAMHVILSRAKYKFMTSSDTSEFVQSESYYIIIIILTDRNENAFDPTRGVYPPWVMEASPLGHGRIPPE